MTASTSKWDPAEYLSDGPSIRAYAEAALEDGSEDLLSDAIDVIARALGMTAIAQAAGIPRDGLCPAFKGERTREGEMSPRDVLLAIACARRPAAN